MLSLELISTGKIKESASDDLIEILMRDLTRYDEKDVVNAIYQHRLSSEWWPSLSNLVKFITPPETDFQRDLRLSREQREKAHAQSVEFMGVSNQKAITTRQSNTDTPEHRSSVIHSIMHGLKSFTDNHDSSNDKPSQNPKDNPRYTKEALQASLDRMIERGLAQPVQKPTEKE